ncbi:hypothetical protein N7486_003748 [Penicillium sp. IBT 16267x]|nr:hypothetical protein N7486_003748 [Penicillium sp. IBT 16267x]
MPDMNNHEDPAEWLERHVNPYVPSAYTHPAYEDAALAAHSARMEHIRSQQRPQQQIQQQAQQPTGEPGGHFVRLSAREVLSPQYVRPSDIGPSFQYYPPNTSHRAIVSFPRSSQPLGGAMQTSRPVTTQQRTSQNVSESQFPEAQRSSTSTSNHIRQERNSVTPMPNGLPLPRQQYGGHQNQARASARFANQSDPAPTSANLNTDTYASATRSSLGPQSKNQTAPSAPKPSAVAYAHPSKKPAVVTPAAASAVSHPAAQMPLNVDVQRAQMDASVSSSLMPNPLHRPASRSSREPGLSKPYPQTTSMPEPQSPCQSPVIPGKNNAKNSQSGSDLAQPHSQTGPGNGTMVPNHQFQPSSRPSVTQGQKPPNKMRRLDNGSRHANGAITNVDTPRTKQASRKTPQGGVDLVTPLDVNDMFLKDSYDVATIARDVLMVAGKHPSEKVLNYHLLTLSKKIPVVDNTSDLTSLRWDRIAPLIYARDKRPLNPTRPPAQPNDATSAVAPPSSHGSSLPSQPSLPLLPYISQPTKLNSSTLPPPPILSTPVPAPARAPSKPRAAAETPTAELSSTSRSKVPSTSPRAEPSAQSPRTKEYLQPQVVIRSPPQQMPPTKKRIGRPKKDAKGDDIAVAVPSPSQPTTQFPVFKCQWEKCPTEVHTLVLLQRHVLKAHIPHNITCGWKECDNSTPMAASAMWEHLRDTHFKDYAWALGDGPAVPSPGEESEDKSPVVPQFNLFDRQARVATVLLPLEDSVVKTYSQSHGITNSKQRAELFKDAGCRWKEEAGPDVDISDRRLSTPPRLVTSRLTEIAMTLSESP